MLLDFQFNPLSQVYQVTNEEGDTFIVSPSHVDRRLAAELARLIPDDSTFWDKRRQEEDKKRQEFALEAAKRERVERPKNGAKVFDKKWFKLTEPPKVEDALFDW